MTGPGRAEPGALMGVGTAFEGVLFEGVIFDLDGVVADTEHFWDASWGTYSRDHGVAWTQADSLGLQGLSVPEWSARLVEHVGGNPDEAQDAARYCIDYILAALDRGEGALMDGAREMVELAYDYGPVGLATSSARAAAQKPEGLGDDSP